MWHDVHVMWHDIHVMWHDVQVMWHDVQVMWHDILQRWAVAGLYMVSTWWAHGEHMMQCTCCTLCYRRRKQHQEVEVYVIWAVFCLLRSMLVIFTVDILQRAAVKPPTINAYETGFKFHAQPQSPNWSIFDKTWEQSTQNPQCQTINCFKQQIMDNLSHGYICTLIRFIITCISDSNFCWFL